MGDHRVMAVCTVDTVTTVSAQTAPNPSTPSHSQPEPGQAREPTIISIFPRPARHFISANQDGANIDNHIHIAADIARARSERKTSGKVNDEH